MKKLLNVFRKISIIFGIVFLILIIGLFVINKIFITPEFIEKEFGGSIKKIFKDKIEFKITEISLFKGIEIRNLKIYNPSYSSKPVFVSIDKLILKYDLLALVALKFQVSEVDFDKPYIFLEYYPAKNKWNFSDFIPSQKKEIKKNEKEKKSANPVKINLSLNKFDISNLQIEFIKGLYFKLQDIYFAMDIKMDPTSLEGLKQAHLILYNKGTENIVFKNQGMNLKMPLNLNVNINIPNRSQGKILFSYELKNQLIDMYNNVLTLPNIKFLFDSNISLDSYQLNINNFLFEINDNPLLSFKGQIVKFNKSPEYRLTASNNFLNINSFEDLMKILLQKPDLKVNGQFTTSNFLVQKKGLAPFPLIMGQLNLRNINFSLPKDNLFVKNCNFTFNTATDQKDGINGQLNINIDDITAKIIDIKNFNFHLDFKYLLKHNQVESINIKANNCLINNGVFNANLKYLNKKIDGEISLEHLAINQFNNVIGGELDVKDNVNGDLSEQLNNNLNIKSTNFKFYSIVSNSKFPSKNIPMNISSSVYFNLKDKDIIIKDITVKAGEIINALFTGRFDLNNKKFVGKLKYFNIDSDNIISVLPNNIILNLPYQEIKGTFKSDADIAFTNNNLKIVFNLPKNNLILNNQNNGIIINDFQRSSPF